MSLPKWVECAQDDWDTSKLIEALSIAWGALESSSLPPYKDSDLKGLLETVNSYSKEAMHRIEELGK